MYVLQRNIESDRQLPVASQDRVTKGETKVCEMGKVGPYTTQIGSIQYRSYHSPHNGYEVQVQIYILCYLYGVEL